MREALGEEKEGVRNLQDMLCRYIMGKYEKDIGGFEVGGDTLLSI